MLVLRALFAKSKHRAWHGNCFYYCHYHTICYERGHYDTQDQNKHKYRHRGLDGDMGVSLNPDPSLRPTCLGRVYSHPHLINVYTNLLILLFALGYR